MKNNVLSWNYIKVPVGVWTIFGLKLEKSIWNVKLCMVMEIHLKTSLWMLKTCEWKTLFHLKYWPNHNFNVSVSISIRSWITQQIDLQIFVCKMAPNVNKTNVKDLSSFPYKKIEILVYFVEIHGGLNPTKTRMIRLLST